MRCGLTCARAATQTTVNSTDAKNGTVSFDETLKCMSRVARAWQDDELLARKLEDESPDGTGDAPDIAEAFKVRTWAPASSRPWHDWVTQGQP